MHALNDFFVKYRAVLNDEKISSTHFVTNYISHVFPALCPGMSKGKSKLSLPTHHSLHNECCAAILK